MTWRPDIERLMRSEAETIAAVARVMASERSTARFESFGHGYIVALGPGRYVNRALGVGPELEDGHIDQIERFFDQAGLAPSVQVSSLTSEATLTRLARRGFRSRWFRWVMAARLDKTHADAAGPAVIVEVDEALVSDWKHVLATANGAISGDARSISDEYALAAHRVESSVDLVAKVGGLAVACGSLEFADGIAWLGGASTLPEYRNRGLQRQLLGHRIREARKLHAGTVAATAEPGSVSARNLARMGLVLVDVQTVLSKNG